MNYKLMLATLAFPLTSLADTLHFPYFPSLTPDAKDIYFSYEGDIFKVSSQGGTATRFISIGGYENYPKVSPDGKFLAFSSDINGNNDVYIVPMEGGEAKKLTWHEANDTPVGWSNDSKYVYFESDRSNIKTTYKVSIEGQTPVRLAEGYFNTMINVTENPVTGELYFNESNESIRFPTRKRYMGDHNPDVKSWNPSTGKYSVLTDYKGKDTWPMVDANGTIYYVSDRSNQEANLYRYDGKNAPVQLTDFNQSIQYPSISRDGSKIVFLLEYQITCLDTRSGKITIPAIQIAGHKTTPTRVFSNQHPDYTAISPDGKKLALSIRGKLYIADNEGKYLKLLSTPEDERVTELIWTDNETVYYTRTNKGYFNLYQIKADGSAPETTIYTTENNLQSLTLSHQKDKIAFISGNRQVMVLHIPQNRIEKIADAQFWSFMKFDMNFSFDDSLLAFEAINLFEPDIYIYSFDEKKVTNLTRSASVEGSPCFAPDGKSLYLTADPYASSFPRGEISTSLYRLPLQRYNQKPFKSDIYDSLFVKKENIHQTEKDSDHKTSIDYSEIFRRLEKVEDKVGSVFTYSNGKDHWLIYAAKTKMKMKQISDPYAEAKEINDLKPGGRFKTSDKELFYQQEGKLYRVDLKENKVKEIKIGQDLEKNLYDEYRQIFYEGWATMEQNFYDVNFHDVNWKQKRDYYASFLPFVRERSHFRTLFNDMLGELNSSHLGFSSKGDEEQKAQTPAYTAETGIIWDNRSPYIINRILTDSPANSVDIDLKAGDRLIAVNGKRISEEKNREEYFSFATKPSEISLTLNRSGKEFTVKLHTLPYGELKNMLYTEWEDNCKKKVEQGTDGRVAYIHMRDMTDDALQTFLLGIHTELVNKDALILDLRYNNGGNVHKEVIDVLRQQAHFNWSYRDFEKNPHPNVTPSDKPIVVLINERSLSDAEVTSNGIKQLGIAKLIGTETYRWIIFTSGVRFVDGSTSRMPAWGCYSLQGKDLEKTGVVPDIYVKNTFEDRLKGKDPQLETAIQEIMKELNLKKQ